MIDIEFNPSEYSIKMTGHANADVEGKDIVCSAASTLVYTLKDSLEQASDMLEDLTATVEKGNAEVKCTPKTQFEGNIQTIYWVVLNGFASLAESYPDYVTFSPIG